MMRRALAARLSRALVGCYPHRWRQRYGEELLDVLDQHRPGVRTVLDLGASALGAHLDPAWMERLAMIRRHKNGLAAAAAAGIAVLMMLALVVGIEAWKEEHGPPLPLSQATFGVAFSPDGRVLATAGGGSGVLWNVAGPARLTEIAVLPGPGGIGAVLFFPDGRILGTADNGTVVLWNVADPARVTHITTLTGHAGDVTALSFSPDGHLLASASGGGTAVMWDVADPARVTHITTLTRQADGVSALSFSPDGHQRQRQRRRHGGLAEPYRPGRAGHHRHAALHRPAAAIPRAGDWP
jgi:hypothetical protein